MNSRSTTNNRFRFRVLLFLSACTRSCIHALHITKCTWKPKLRVVSRGKIVTSKSSSGFPLESVGSICTSVLISKILMPPSLKTTAGESHERERISPCHTPLKQKHERTIHPAHTSSEQVSYQEQSQLFARIIPEALSRRPTCTHSTVSLRAFESTRDRHNRCACSVRFPLCPTSLNDLYYPPPYPA